MTNEEAIKILREILTEAIEFENSVCYVTEEDREPLEMAIEALKNQKTMQVELEGDGYADGELVYDYGKCPKCGWDFEDGDKDWEEPYCCHCGQRLHWFDKQMKGD